MLLRQQAAGGSSVGSVYRSTAWEGVRAAVIKTSVAPRGAFGYEQVCHQGLAPLAIGCRPLRELMAGRVCVFWRGDCWRIHKFIRAGRVAEINSLHLRFCKRAMGLINRQGRQGSPRERGVGLNLFLVSFFFAPSRLCVRSILIEVSRKGAKGNKPGHFLSCHFVCFVINLPVSQKYQNA